MFTAKILSLNRVNKNRRKRMMAEMNLPTMIETGGGFGGMGA